MKKHFLGFALFSLIVASFAFVYAFFSAPSIPSKEAVKPPVSQTETRTEKPYRCNLRDKNKLSYEVLSSQYFVGENKIVSKIRVTLDKYASLPERIYVSTTYSSAGNIGRDGFGDLKILDNPFANSRELVVEVASKVTGGKKLDIDENLYVMASVTDYDGSASYKRNGEVTQAKAVLFVFDE